MPSLSSLERACPPSRRRSCLACTKAKRRCDNTLPACVRCRRRGVECLYPVRQPDPSPAQQGQTATKSSTTSDGAYTFLPLQPCDLLLDTAEPPSCGSTASPFHSLSQAYVDTATVFDFVSHAHDVSIHDADKADHTDNVAGGQLSLIPAPPLPLSAPLAAADWNYVSRIIASHLGHAMDIIRDAPRLFVLENRLPWSHPRLYRDGMPRAMEDALSSCALYQAKNSVNTSVVLRTIDRRLHDLLAAPEPTSPLECIAKTQALLLYNIIGIFDTDINARATVENTQPLLRRAARRLLSFITFDALQDAPDEAALVLSAHAFWDSWVLMESARRTFLISLYFMHLYSVVVGSPLRTCDERKYLNRYWTISASLWHASCPLDFARAWRANRFFLARIGNFDQLLAEARAEDIDDFSRIFLSSLMGIDDFSRWMASRDPVEV
ncbi:hypothetical protein SPBR_01743 [Sporothrix brasiliensis 5110]|uniref:Zn(2)-C6 fungal-type domain-containing protein n=1 Tax=Sporothrix brasiliensis 5110 TaxID=1398154 RepID=A0A0C2IQ80_9PEZI|nr:uncharacterized protein SPBR_01743 [Sporothrix brasiliensis 5110]KIH91201.1 hypothetical protein SPBR_01743 [Sporothrix brasiliensis 5110]